MSDFNLAVAVVLEREGGLSNHVHDHGGVTNFGISMRYLLQKNHHALEEDIQKLTKEEAMRIYQEDWWDRYQYGRIQDQSIATKLLDLAINMGPQHAHICIQRALRASSGKAVSEDGILGDETVFAINMASSDLLLAALKSEAAGYYRSLNQPAFEAGWLNRSYR